MNKMNIGPWLTISPKLAFTEIEIVIINIIISLLN
jgi:hypothetical protein